MQASTDRLEFTPPPTPGGLRSLGLALLAHAFLLAALTWGVHWRSEPVTMSAEAELWSSLPQEAAPKLVERPQEPPTPPEPPEPIIKPAPVRPAQAPTETLKPDANIALAQEKMRLKKEKQQELEKQQQAALKLEKLKQEKLKREKLEKEAELAKQEKLKQEKLLLEKKQLADKRLQEKASKAAADTKRNEVLKAQQDKLDAQKMEAQRAANLNRIAGLAGSTGSPTSQGATQKSSGPSDSYSGRIKARIKPNIVFVDEIIGNPVADVEVRLASDGTIISRKLTKPSGNKAWDEAVLKAIDKTEVLPRDVDGRIISPLTIVFRPKD